MAWTEFCDMYSGGRAKEDFEYIYIEAPQDEAAVIFYNRFGHSPDRVTCTCCGADYSVIESETLEHATAYERGEWSDWEETKTLEQYIASGEALFIRANDIQPHERQGDVPTQGYVWI